MKIKKMPTKEMLEDYLDGSYGDVKVLFDVEKGEFVYSEEHRQNLNKEVKNGSINFNSSAQRRIFREDDSGCS